MSTGLTPTINPSYAVTTAAKSAVGFGDLNDGNGVHTPQNLVGVFFRLQDSFLVVCAGNYPHGLVAEFHCPRFANLAHAATLSFGEDGCQQLNKLTMVHIMTTSNVFVLNESTSTQNLIYYALDASYNHKAVALALSQLSESQYDATQFYDQIHSLSNLLLSELQRQHVLLEQLHAREVQA